MANALDALQLLKDGKFQAGGSWKKAHEICQGHEGQPDFDWVHALCHRIEGDEANADYWYRSAGKKRHSPDIEAEWSHVREHLAGKTRESA